MIHSLPDRLQSFTALGCLLFVVRHLPSFPKSFSRNGILEIDDALIEIGGFVSFAESQAHHGFAFSILVRDANDKVATGISDGFDKVVHGLIRNIDLGHGKKFGRGTGIFVGKDNEENLSSSFNPQTALFEGFAEIPFVSAVRI